MNKLISSAKNNKKNYHSTELSDKQYVAIEVTNHTNGT